MNLIQEREMKYRKRIRDMVKNARGKDFLFEISYVNRIGRYNKKRKTHLTSLKIPGYLGTHRCKTLIKNWIEKEVNNINIGLGYKNIL